jgi:hypothetical protein
MEEECIEDSVGRTEEEEIPLGRLRLMWEDNIKMNLKERGC